MSDITETVTVIDLIPSASSSVREAWENYVRRLVAEQGVDSGELGAPQTSLLLRGSAVDEHYGPISENFPVVPRKFRAQKNTTVKLYTRDLIRLENIICVLKGEGGGSGYCTSADGLRYALRHWATHL